MKKFKALPNPCDTCPYRRDTPPGIWSREEYDKLPRWDNDMDFSAGIFLCHNDPMAICRGWFEVHGSSLSVRLAGFQVDWNKRNLKATNCPLYSSGHEARAAGIAGIKHLSSRAKRSINKILRKRLH